MVKSKNSIQFEIQEKLSFVIAKFGEDNDAPSAYNTAWAARLTNEFEEAQFPLALLWLHANQNEDGSWGNFNKSSFYSDRIISTFAALTALKEWSDRGTNGLDAAIEMGMRFLNQSLSQLKERASFPIGVGTLLPKLFLEAKRAGLRFEEHKEWLEQLVQKHKARVALVPSTMIHNRSTAFLYALECFEEGVLDWNRILTLQENDGSFVSSPSTTAFVYQQTKDEKCLAYLQDVWADHGYMPEFS
jgi:hypothetical protein